MKGSWELKGCENEAKARQVTNDDATFPVGMKASAAVVLGASQLDVAHSAAGGGWAGL